MNTQERLAMRSQITGQGEPLVLVPGGLTGWLSWQPHAERLTEEYQVIRVQLLSVEFGLKDTPLPANYSVLSEKEALQHTLDDLGIEAAHFAGWSYGALTSLMFALEHPDRVRSLVLIEPPAIWVLRSRGPLPEEVQADWRAFQAFGPGDVTAEQLADFIRIAALAPPGTDPRELPQWPGWIDHRQSLRISDAPYRLEGNIERVQRFDRPVMLLKGHGSAAFYHAVIDILADEFPNARVEALPGGHAAHIVSMEPFIEMFQAFLSASRADDA